MFSSYSSTNNEIRKRPEIKYELFNKLSSFNLPRSILPLVPHSVDQRQWLIRSLVSTFDVQ